MMEYHVTLKIEISEEYRGTIDKNILANRLEDLPTDLLFKLKEAANVELVKVKRMNE